MFTFDGLTSDDMGVRVISVKRSVVSPVTRATQAVAGMPGAYLMATNIGERIIDFEVDLVSLTLLGSATDMHALA